MIISGVEISSSPGMRTQVARSKADDYNLWIWGNNSFGQLGDNTLIGRISPVQTIAGGTNWAVVPSGNPNYSAAIKTDGTLWNWGRNNYGNLGDDTTISKSSPVQTIAGGTNWKQVSSGQVASRLYVGAIKTDGTLWTWGNNYQGMLGDNTVIHRSSPVQTVAGGSNWSSIACGTHMAAVKTDGTLWTWGYNNQGQLGTNNTNNRSAPGQTIAGGSNWSVAAAGMFYTAAAIKTDGTLWTWGYNQNGQLGDGSSGAGTSKSSPAQTASATTNWASISCGTFHMAAIKTDGTLWTWGTNGYDGSLGINVFANGAANKSSPVQTIAGGNNWRSVSAGGYTTAAIKNDGTLWAWGRNSDGQVGNGSTSVVLSPVQTIAGGTNWYSVGLSQTHVLAISATTYAE